MSHKRVYYKKNVEEWGFFAMIEKLESMNKVMDELDKYSGDILVDGSRY